MSFFFFCEFEWTIGENDHNYLPHPPNSEMIWGKQLALACGGEKVLEERRGWRETTYMSSFSKGKSKSRQLIIITFLLIEKTIDFQDTFPSFHKNQKCKNKFLKNPIYIIFSGTWVMVGKLWIHFFFFLNKTLTPNFTFWSKNNLSLKLFNLKMLLYCSYICSRKWRHTRNCRHSWKVRDTQRNTWRDLAI